jgi:histidyl-tRNA synthetase
LDAEVIGAAEPAADVELLAFADQLLHELGVADGVLLQLNTLGDSATRDAWRQALVAHFEGNRGDLSEESQDRLLKNPLRILDSKDPRDRPIADAAPEIDAHMSSEAGAFFEAVTKGLDAAGVAWTRNARLVRGLDYYRHTAFEFVTDRLGAQGTVLGGGRYDGLIETLGGSHTPAVGWAAGIERLAMLIETPAADVPIVVMALEDDTVIAAATQALAALRRAGFATELIASGSPRKRYDKAARIPAKVLVSIRQDGGKPTFNLRSSPGILEHAEVERILALVAAGA